MRLFHMLAGAVLGLAVPGALAAAPIPMVDYQTRLNDGDTVIGMECHWKNQTLEIGQFDSTRPPPRRMDLWSAWNLVHFNDKTGILTKTLSVERQCKLGAATFKVRFTGAPGNANIQGRCGAFVNARATVWKNGRKLFDQEFEDCMGEQPGIATVRFTPASDTPIITPLPPPGTN